MPPTSRTPNTPDLPPEDAGGRKRPPAPPRMIGPYRIEGELGRGGMGVVYRGFDPRLARSVAIKVVSPGSANESQRRARFEREARVLASLNHPNIGAIYGLETLEGTREVGLVLEYVDGPTLADRLMRSGPGHAGIDVPEALEIARQIAAGLEAAHEAGVVHRDLKPANVKVRPDGTVKVLDFGLSRAGPEAGQAGKPIGSDLELVRNAKTASLVRTMQGAVMGTPGYMSPEQARGRTLDKRTDIWSFGCVLFEVLTGRCAFDGDSVESLLRAVTEQEPEWGALPAATPSRVRDLLKRCLEKDARKRLRDIGDARIELEVAIAGSEWKRPEEGSAAARRTPNNLPRAVSSFIGRSRETQELVGLLDPAGGGGGGGGAVGPRPRLVTLAGAGGCGKTRLAIRVASELLGKFRDGVYLAELGAVAEPKLVWSAVAAAMSAAEEPGKALSRTVVERIGEQRMLLVLDNCEHLLESCGTVAQTLLESCPNLKVMATSREALGIGGEAAWRVPSLSIPPEPEDLPVAAGGAGAEQFSAFESVQLFVERAAAAQAGFALNAENAPAVSAICRRLDGIPLAIELAAARVRVFDVEQINQKLDDRFRLLTGGSRTALERHQTLRATIDWSYALLSPAERRLLRALAVFAGGWTLEAAEAVCAEARVLPRKGGRSSRSK